MPDREYWKKRARAEASIAGVDADVFERLIDSESSFSVMGQHPGSNAMGLGGLMPGTAKGLGVNPMDPQQNLQGAAQYLRQMYDKFKDWGKAVEAYKMGPGNVGNMAFRSGHQGEWAGVNKVMGTLYPNSLNEPFDPTVGAARDKTATLRDDVTSAQTELSTAMGQPFNLPRSPILPARSPAAIGLPSLFANLASAISGNPLYQQVQEGEFAQEDQSREQAQATNLGLSRQEVMQKRQEGLTAIANRLEYAQKRLEDAGHHQEALDLQNQHMQALEKLQKLHDQAEKERTDAQITGDLDKEYARLGLLRDADGNLQPNTALSKLSGLMDENEVQQRIGAINSLLSDSKRNKKDDQALIDQRNQLQYATVRKGQTWESVKGMVAQGYPDKAQQAQILEILAHRHPELGASYLKAIEDASRGAGGSWGQHMQSGPVPLEGQKGQPVKPATPAKAPENTDTSPFPPMYGASPEEMASHEVTFIQHQIEHTERFFAKKGYPDTGLLAGLYKKLEKARKDLETIRNKGKTPEKSK